MTSGILGHSSMGEKQEESEAKERIALTIGHTKNMTVGKWATTDNGAGF